MKGPSILARTLSNPTVKGKGSHPWQYHSRSDAHSKIACWIVLFDLIQNCDAFRALAVSGQISFGINKVLVGPINKTLDLVVTLTKDAPGTTLGKNFIEYGKSLGIALADEEIATLASIESFREDRGEQVREVAIALEAKACMTEHIKSLPRLHAEILATGYLVKLAEPSCISVSYTLVNAASQFSSPSAPARVNTHSQPSDCRRVVDMIAKAIPSAKSGDRYGYDVIGVTAINCRNDLSPVSVVSDQAYAPSQMESIHYERMIASLCSAFRSRFYRAV